MRNKSSFSAGTKAFFLLAGVIFFMYIAVPAQGATFNVPGTSDPWLAGMPNGTTASFNPGSGEAADVAPAQSPVLVTGIAITPGTMLQWSATGQVGHPGDVAGPDGFTAVNTLHFTGAEHGISDINVPIDSLLGVFLGINPPNLISAPSALDFSLAGSRNYLSLSPALQQVFFMGDGVTSGSVLQTIVAPAGATRLYLGTMDGFSWNNNIGSFDVSINAVPEPFTMLLLGAGLLGLVGFRKTFTK
ncbi:MAG TPA: PEP-CTERM sorting domain-containing protein [Syntrophales bacterium]|nr:PEP-CTERM sorting domain-containing protein [Syntrophales bacterium]